MFLTSVGIAQTSDAGLLRSGPGNAVKRCAPTGHETIRDRVSNPPFSVLKPPAGRPSVPLRAGDGTMLYGEVVYSDLMNTDDPDAIKWGVYSFPASPNTTFTEKVIHNTICANGGGAYRKGKLYFTSYYEGYEPGSLLYLYFCTLDVNTWTLDKKAINSNYFSTIGLDMTYDPVGDIIYMQAYQDDAGTATSYKYTLSTMDIETGRSTPIALLDRMSMIACDVAGQLYGVRYNDGMLCKIDKTTAAVTEVGLTGVNPQYNGSGTFDFKTGKLYWSTMERVTGQSGLYEVDTATGRAAQITVYPANEQVSCLYIPQDGDDSRLGDIPSLTADFSNQSSTTGTVSVQAPAADVDGNVVTGDITIFIYVDGKLTFSKPCAPGATVTETLTLSKGSHKVEAVATHPAVGKSRRKSVDVWVGPDGPAAVTNLKAEKTGEYTCTLTWDAPAVGEHGGTINPNLTYYEIRRFPGNELIAEDATGTSYTDNISNTRFRYYTYSVKSISKGVSGGTATSERIAFGVPDEIPYTETFDDFNAFKSYLVSNANEDEGFWGYNLGLKCAMYKYDTFNRADDWLITPALNLGASNTYKLRFKARSESRLYPEELEVYIGNGPDVADFTTVLLERTTLAHEDYREYEAVISVNDPGTYFIGFHAVTVKGQYFLYLDDVEVTDGPSANAPGVVTDVSVSQAEGGTNRAVLTFTTPAVDFSGNALTALTAVNVYRNASLIKTFGNPATGKQIVYTDETPDEGNNTYRITAVNEAGESNPVEVTQYIGADVPLPPSDVRQTTSGSSDAAPVAHITWTAPTHGINGGTLNPQLLTYDITDNKGRKVASGISGTSYTDTGIDVSGGQKAIFYYVEAVTDKGKSDAAASGFITYGQPYQDSFRESFSGSKFSSADWIVTVVNPSPFSNAFYGRYWGLSHGGFDRGPVPSAQDHDGGYLVAFTDFTDVSSRMVSPVINVKGLSNPVLTFWFYHYYNPDTENGYSQYDETMTVEVYKNGTFTEVIDKPIHLINGNGWYRYDVKLKESAGNDNFQIAFKTHNSLSYDMHIDNISISDVKDNDLALTKLSVPEKIAVGSQRTLTATVHNAGAKDAAGYKVEFLRDGEVFETVPVADPLPFAGDKEVSVAVSPTITEAGKTYLYSARVVYAPDEDLANNVSSSVRSEVPSNNLPTVTTLRATDGGSGVELLWDDPAEPEGNTPVSEGFETYEKFTISKMGDWTLVDNDKANTYTIQNSQSGTGDYDYPNAGEPMAWQVFNPSAIDLNSRLWTPYLGNQMAVCFAAAGSVNDDWLISPDVVGGSKVTFMAKSVTAIYGLEKFWFCYSATDKSVSSFVRMGDVNVVPAGEWTRYEFVLPADAKYFAINCVSEDTYAMLLDEITYQTSEPVILTLEGFNVYRDGVRINRSVVEEGRFLDGDVTAGSPHYYNVTAVYDRGESAFSNTVNTGGSGIADAQASLPSVYATKGMINVDNAAGRSIRIFDLSGRLLHGAVAGSDHYSVAVGGGVYIVSADSRVVKVTVRH